MTKKIVLVSKDTNPDFFYTFVEKVVQEALHMQVPVFYDTVEAAMADVARRGLPPGMEGANYATVEINLFKQEKIDA